MAGVSMCVLLVEDEMVIRMMLADVLSDAGFMIKEAASGDEAAELIRNPPATFSLLITDVHMPGTLDGLQVARLMRERQPGMPTIYMTGRPDVVRATGPLGAGEVLFPKPFSPFALLDLAHRLAWKSGEQAIIRPQR